VRSRLRPSRSASESPFSVQRTIPQLSVFGDSGRVLQYLDGIGGIPELRTSLLGPDLRNVLLGIQTVYLAAAGKSVLISSTLLPRML
jgi:hypothetical protein